MRGTDICGFGMRKKNKIKKINSSQSHSYVANASVQQAKTDFRGSGTQEQRTAHRHCNTAWNLRATTCDFYGSSFFSLVRKGIYSQCTLPPSPEAFVTGSQKVSGSGNRAVGSVGDPVGGAWRALRSLQQLLKLAFFQLGIVSDFIERVRLHNLPVLKDGVQQVLEVRRDRNEARRSGQRLPWTHAQTHHAVLLQVALALLQGDKVSALCPVQGQTAFLGPLVGVCHWVLEHVHLLSRTQTETIRYTESAADAKKSSEQNMKLTPSPFVTT